MPRQRDDRREGALRDLLLVVVTDRKRCRGGLVESCEAALRGGATAVLLRDRDLSRAGRGDLARRLRSITKRYTASLLVHTDAALAREVDADGVHLDSQAGPAEIAAARRVVGRSRLVGVSTHSPEEVRHAEKAGADYAFLGPVARTRSHRSRGGIGWVPFYLCERKAGIPVLAIGGVSPTSLRAAGFPEDAPRVAAVDVFLAAADPSAAAGAMAGVLSSFARRDRNPPPSRSDERALVASFLQSMGRISALRLGPGDDAVVLRKGGTAMALDLTVEGVHYEPGTPARAAGFKAAGRALSDLAAVGAVPVGVMVGISARTAPRARGLEAGVSAAARAVGARVLGGDTKQSRGAETVAVTAVGLLEGPAPLARSGGRPGDALFVSGPLGGSARGRHLRPRPRIATGLALRRGGLATACIDLSDGLASDLHRLCGASGTGAFVDLARIPVHGDSHWSEALFDGEDYELLFAVPPEKAAAVEARGVAGRRVHRIGRLVHRNAGLVVQEESGRLVPLPDEGWVHFRERDR